MSDNDICYLWSPYFEATQSPWEEILHLGKKKRFRKNCIILGPGQFADELYYLHLGEVKLSSVSANGDEKPVWYIKNGNIFGEVPFWDHGFIYNTITCIEDSIIFTFNRELLTESVFPHYPQIVNNIFETMAKKIRLLSSQINDLGLNPPKLRVYKMIYSLLSNPQNETKHISQQELADLLGIHRVTLNRIIAELKNDGIILNDVNHKGLLLCDSKRLLDLIAEEQ